MEWLRQLFITNEVIVFALYGQVFFTLGVALAVQSMKHTRLHLGKQLRWLAAFGLTHGLVEWGYVFIPIQASYLPVEVVDLLRWLQLALLVLSFVFLFQFGVRAAVRDGPLTVPVWNWLLTGCLTAASAALGLVADLDQRSQMVSIEIWVRYLLAVPGAAAAAHGVWDAAREVRDMQVPRVGRSFQVSALSLAGYGLLNLVTPDHHGLVFQWVDYSTVMQAVGVPVQLWRTLVGAGILFGMLRSLSVFEVETDRLLMAAQQQKLLEAERELEVMNQIAVTLGRARDPRRAMEAVLAQMLSFLRCESGEIAWRDDGDDTWRALARAGPVRESGPGRPVSPLVADVAQEGQVVTHQLDGGRYGVGIPVRVGRRVLAVAAMYREEPIALAWQERQVLISLGNLLGVALENSRLWAAVQQKEAARTEWIHRILTAQEDERRRIAHELHDETVQELVVLCRRLDSVEEHCGSIPPPVRSHVVAARNQVERVMANLRTFARDLRPPALDDLGVLASIRRLLADLNQRSGVQWELRTAGPQRRLDRDTELGLFRIAQEAIRNVERHARAEAVSVDIQFDPDSVTLRVRDDGQGMAERKADPGLDGTPSLGLLGMQERAALLGGELHVASQPGQGTTVAVTIPLTAKARTP